MILETYSDEQFQNELVKSSDWRAAIAAMILAWCASQDQERALTTIKKFGFLNVTIRVKHIVQIVPVIFGTETAQKPA